MPTYEYICTKCAARLEVVRSFSDPPLTRCPTCRGKLRKVFGSVGVVLKGSGFYRTDNRSGGSASRPAVREPAAASGADDSGTNASATTSKSGAPPASSPVTSGAAAGKAEPAKT